MRTAVYFFLLAVLSLTSCQQIMDNYWDRQQQESYVSPYRGTYKGTFSGDDSGTLEIIISKKDQVTVNLHSDKRNTDETFFDALIGSSFNGNASPTSGFKLLGNLNSQNNSYSGTWKQGIFSGTWTIKKQ